MKIHDFIPKSYIYLRRGYGFATLKKDLLAGLTVAIIAFPLATAFAIASGVEPARGLYTAIIAGFLISAFSGSRVQIGGPTGAFVVIVYDIVQRTGYNGLCISTLIAAIFLILLGIFRVGSWIKYIPLPLVTGFTTGIAFIIFSSQIKDFFGLSMGVAPAHFIEKWNAYFHAFPTLDPLTTSLSLGTLVFIIFIRRFIPWLPWGLSVIILSTLACFAFSLPLETIESRFGTIPRTLPFPSLYIHVPIEHWKELLIDAIAIAFLGGIESLLSAVIGDKMIKSSHKSNCELIAQGIANFGSVLFGGIPATGAIARTAANVKCGAQTPVAGMTHAVVLFFILLCLAPVVSQIPLATLSAILMMVAWNMSEIDHFTKLLKAPIGDRLILITTFFLTVFVDITVAISVGMTLACFIFMHQMSQTSQTVPLSKIFQEKDVEIYEIQGPFFFGTANILKELNHSEPPPKTCLLRLRFVPMIDASGMHALKEFQNHCKKKAIRLCLCEVGEKPLYELKKFGLIDTIGQESVFETLDAFLKTVSR